MRTLGALRDPESDVRGEPLRRLVAAARTTLLDAVDLRAHVKVIPEQRGNSCVGHSLAQCIRVRGSVQGVELRPSALAIYTLARELDSPTVPLPDEGSYPSKAIEALSDWGVVSESRWPDTSDLRKPVPIDVLEAGAIAHVTGEYRIGFDRKHEIMAALSAGHPFFFSMNVDTSYMSYTGCLWRGPRYRIQGGHAQTVVGYDSNGPIVANSWSRNWGEDGFSHIAWDWFESDNVYDPYVITTVPLEAA